MSQRLTLPFAGPNVFSAGYKNAAYLEQQGYNHYGVDIFGQNGQNVLALGDGTVVACGMDGRSPTQRLGNCVVIVYKAVQAHDGTVRDLACRMFHLASIAVKAGQTVHRGDLLGVAGNTGSTTVLGKPMGVHLHLEFDRDTQYPQYAYGIGGSGIIIKHGTVDSTVNPSGVWCLGPGQSIWGKYAGWYTDADVALPDLPADDDQLAQALARAELAERELAEAREKYDRLVDGIRRLIAEVEA